MRKTLLGVVLLSCIAVSLRGEKVALPAVASIVGAAPFFSDVRVFNTSYNSPLAVTATYRCFIASVGSTCPATAPQMQFTLAPRQSKPFNDIVAAALAAPGTAGGVEFDFSGSEDQLVVTSRLYSTSPSPTVGMFIAGVSSSNGQTTSVLTSIRNGGAVKGFRTNAGFYNANDASASVTFQIFNDGAPAGNPVSSPAPIPGHSGVQFSSIFSLAGVPSFETESAVIVATSNVPVFAYAAVLDNNTTDPIFVVGAHDQAQTSAPSNATVHVGQGGTVYVDSVSGTGVTTVNVGDTVTWVWEGTLNHGTSSGTCVGGGPGPYGMSPQGYGSSCTPSGTWGSGIHMAPYSYSYTFTQAGTFPYYCNVHMNAMTGRVVVNAQAGAASSKQTAAR
ncbi:MAG: plastocyanin/azurin family copper-binding protein [Acidobacteriota bacterium]